MSKLILASASKSRLELLQQASIKIAKTIPANIDETRYKQEKAKDMVLRLASEKAKLISKKNKNYWIIGADNTVSCGSRILEKPQNIDEAKYFLQLLSGRRHNILGGLAVITPEGKIITRCIKTIVKVKRLTIKEIDDYLNSNEWQGKAGAYAIQGSFAVFVNEIIGSYSNIVGLCVYNLRQILIGNNYQDL